MTDTYEEWWKSLEVAVHLKFDALTWNSIKILTREAWQAAQPQWLPIKDAPLNVRILVATEGDAPDICKLSLSPSGILVAQLDCGSQYNAKDMYEVYMELPKP